MMAKHERTYYTCDRCKIEMSNHVLGAERGPVAFSLVASQDYGVAGGAVISWKDLCEDCNSYVGSEIRRLIEEANK